MQMPASPCRVLADRLHQKYLALLPLIMRQASIHFRDIICQQKRSDLISECVALGWQWFLALSRRGKDASQFPATFAQLLARAVRSGRKLAGQEQAGDVMNPSAQRRLGFRVESLPSSPRASHEQLYSTPRGQALQDAYEERLRDNTVTPVPDQVQFRLDLRAWLKTLSGRERRIVRAMMRDERTTDLADTFRVSPGRISQLRRQFLEDWSRFCGDDAQEC